MNISRKRLKSLVVWVTPRPEPVLVNAPSLTNHPVEKFLANLPRTKHGTSVRVHLASKSYGPQNLAATEVSCLDSMPIPSAHSGAGPTVRYRFDSFASSLSSPASLTLS